MRIIEWQTATTRHDEHPSKDAPKGLVAAGPWEPIGCSPWTSLNGGLDVKTVWRRPLGDGSYEAAPVESGHASEMMAPIKCARVERIPGKLPPPPVAGSSWFATQAEHVNGLGQWTTWALVPDEAPASSPSEADIARRVELLAELATDRWKLGKEPEDIARELRIKAIEQLLAERAK